MTRFVGLRQILDDGECNDGIAYFQYHKMIIVNKAIFTVIQRNKTLLRFCNQYNSIHLLTTPNLCESFISEFGQGNYV